MIMPRRKEYTKNACTNCARAKKKCEWMPAEGTCTRCKFRNEFCLLKSHQKRGRQAKNPIGRGLL